MSITETYLKADSMIKDRIYHITQVLNKWMSDNGVRNYLNYTDRLPQFGELSYSIPNKNGLVCMRWEEYDDEWSEESSLKIPVTLFDTGSDSDLISFFDETYVKWQERTKQDTIRDVRKQIRRLETEYNMQSYEIFNEVKNPFHR